MRRCSEPGSHFLRRLARDSGVEHAWYLGVARVEKPVVAASVTVTGARIVTTTTTTTTELVPNVTTILVTPLA